MSTRTSLDSIFRRRSRANTNEDPVARAAQVAVLRREFAERERQKEEVRREQENRRVERETKKQQKRDEKEEVYKGDEESMAVVRFLVQDDVVEDEEWDVTAVALNCRMEENSSESSNGGGQAFGLQLRNGVGDGLRKS
ncbi:MAG: hypothetical protein LQ350_005210 [Teloschistes chrysophthalmus]|nr:MAG: hypothetical protein LQ350_005210 [Niorma chrysophthalma]